jgi:hypothetical protein
MTTTSISGSKSFSYDVYTARQLFERYMHLTRICADLPNPHGFNDDPVWDALYSDMEAIRDHVSSRPLDSAEDWKALCALTFIDFMGPEGVARFAGAEPHGVHAGLFDRMRAELEASGYAEPKSSVAASDDLADFSNSLIPGAFPVIDTAA